MEIEMETGSSTGLISLLTRVSKALHRRTPESVLGMKWRQSTALGYLLKHNGATQQELGDAMLIDNNSVVLLLNELEAAGFSVRRRDPGAVRTSTSRSTPFARSSSTNCERVRVEWPTV